MINTTCKTVLISAALAAVAGAPANAGMPHGFNTGDPARAAEVNTNFYYTSYLGEGSSYDVDSLSKIVYADDQRFTESCGASSVVLICASVRTSSADGSFPGMSDFSFVREILSDLTVAGETFSSLRAEKFLREDGRFRLRARGIGPVYDARSNQAPLEFVYHHVNGESEGSLDGTPFAPGARLDGLFF